MATDDKGSEKPTTDEKKTDDAAELKKALQSERDARKAAEKRASDAESKISEFETAQLRSKIAAEKGLTDAQARFLSGSTEEEMTTAADELLESFKPADADKPGPFSRPKEKLRSGASNDSDETPDVSKIADKILGGPGF